MYFVTDSVPYWLYFRNVDCGLDYGLDCVLDYGLDNGLDYGLRFGLDFGLHFKNIDPNSWQQASVKTFSCQDS